MKLNKVRPLAICVFRRGDRVLVAEGYDDLKRQHFYRPLGGKIEFGEYSHQTIIRELQEEIGQDVTDLSYLGTLENIFTYNGKNGHEIVLIYNGTFVDESVYKQDVIEGVEDNHLPFKCMWKSLDFFQTSADPLYPDGLLNLLLKHHSNDSDHYQPISEANDLNI